jgi:hypothetical protein
MRTTSIYAHIYAQIIAALMLTQICLAEQIEQPNVIGGDTAIQTNTPSSDSGSVPASSGTNESWRIVNQNGTWWYYHANGNWSSWDGTRWNLYQPATQTTGSAGATGALDPRGQSVTVRHSGDVEVSGAELGLGAGANSNSGLTNNPGAVINGKGGIGGTKTGAGLPGVGTGVRLPPSGNITAPNPSTGGANPPRVVPNHGGNGGGIGTSPGAVGNGAGGAGQAPSGAGGTGSGAGVTGPQGAAGS